MQPRFVLGKSPAHVAMPVRVLVDSKSRDRMWMLSWESATPCVVSLDERSGAAHHEPVPGLPVTSGHYAGFAQAPDGALWVGVSTTLVRYDQNTHAQTVFKLPAATSVVPPRPGVENSHGSHIVFALAVGNDGHVWVTRGGTHSVTELDPASGEFTDHSLPAVIGSAESLHVDDHGLVWLADGEDLATEAQGAAKTAVVSFDPATQDTRVYRGQSSSWGIGLLGNGRVVSGGTRASVLDTTTGDWEPLVRGGTVVGVTGDDIWLADDSSRILHRLSAAEGSVVADVQLPMRDARGFAHTPALGAAGGAEPKWIGPDLSHQVSGTSAVDAAGRLWIAAPGSPGIWRVTP